MSEDDKILEEITRLFLGTPRKPRKRAAPSRCIDCGKVSKHVRCAACRTARADTTAVDPDAEWHAYLDDSALDEL